MKNLMILSTCLHPFFRIIFVVSHFPLSLSLCLPPKRKFIFTDQVFFCSEFAGNGKQERLSAHFPLEGVLQVFLSLASAYIKLVFLLRY